MSDPQVVKRAATGAGSPKRRAEEGPSKEAAGLTPPSSSLFVGQLLPDVFSASALRPTVALGAIACALVIWVSSLYESVDGSCTIVLSRRHDPELPAAVSPRRTAAQAAKILPFSVQVINLASRPHRLQQFVQTLQQEGKTEILSRLCRLAALDGHEPAVMAMLASKGFIPSAALTPGGAARPTPGRWTPGRWGLTTGQTASFISHWKALWNIANDSSIFFGIICEDDLRYFSPNFDTYFSFLWDDSRGLATEIWRNKDLVYLQNDARLWGKGGTRSTKRTEIIPAKWRKNLAMYAVTRAKAIELTGWTAGAPPPFSSGSSRPRSPLLPVRGIILDDTYPLVRGLRLWAFDPPIAQALGVNEGEDGKSSNRPGRRLSNSSPELVLLPECDAELATLERDGPPPQPAPVPPSEQAQGSPKQAASPKGKLTYTFVGPGLCGRSASEEVRARIGPWIRGRSQTAAEAFCSEMAACQGFQWNSAEKAFVLLRAVGYSTCCASGRGEECYKRPDAGAAAFHWPELKAPVAAAAPPAATPAAQKELKAPVAAAAPPAATPAAQKEESQAQASATAAEAAAAAPAAAAPAARKEGQGPAPGAAATAAAAPARPASTRAGNKDVWIPEGTYKLIGIGHCGASVAEEEANRIGKWVKAARRESAEAACGANDRCEGFHWVVPGAYVLLRSLGTGTCCMTDQGDLCYGRGPVEAGGTDAPAAEVEAASRAAKAGVTAAPAAEAGAASRTAKVPEAAVPAPTAPAPAALTKGPPPGSRHGAAAGAASRTAGQVHSAPGTLAISCGNAAAFSFFSLSTIGGLFAWTYVLHYKKQVSRHGRKAAATTWG